MNTPIIDFVRSYAEKKPLRFHMPGHKGQGPLGIEELDITEISGADSLYEADGIIRESERNASELFGCETLYSTEGSSLCIRAMVYLASLYAREQGRKAKILAGRNAHKTFLSAVALSDAEVVWMYPSDGDSYLSCSIEPAELEKRIICEEPCAVYITSPDYLGNLSDVSALAQVCHKHGVLLMVDNAHGAYLKFLPSSLHPTDLGADICCDSAHKTLPCITGGAYLHITRNAPNLFSEQARNALSLFGSTSPSYLILQSLDAVNKYISDGYAQKLASLTDKLNECKQALTAYGYTLIGNEPLKLTVHAKKYGYSGTEIADILREKNIEPEFADPDTLVLMIAPENRDYGLISLFEALISIPKRPEILTKAPRIAAPVTAVGLRKAMLSPSERVPVSEALGRILASASVGCPPAVPITVCGEVIDIAALNAYNYYGIEYVNVIK